MANTEQKASIHVFCFMAGYDAEQRADDRTKHDGLQAELHTGADAVRQQRRHLLIGKLKGDAEIAVQDIDEIGHIPAQKRLIEAVLLIEHPELHLREPVLIVDCLQKNRQ